jgi:hypothetical protein
MCGIGACTSDAATRRPDMLVTMTDEVLASALAPVLRDLARSGLPAPRIESSDWIVDPNQPSAMLWATDGSGTGVHVSRFDSPEGRIAAAADKVQEWVLDELWGRPWPECPRHPASHPMEARATEVAAVWFCPVDGSDVRVIGSL